MPTELNNYDDSRRVAKRDQLLDEVKLCYPETATEDWRLPIKHPMTYGHTHTVGFLARMSDNTFRLVLACVKKGCQIGPEGSQELKLPVSFEMAQLWLALLSSQRGETL